MLGAEAQHRCSIEGLSASEVPRFRATALATSRIPMTMAALQIVRGTTPLPADVEEQFRRAYGREMNETERKFYGLESESASDTQYLPQAA